MMRYRVIQISSTEVEIVIEDPETGTTITATCSKVTITQKSPTNHVQNKL